MKQPLTCSQVLVEVARDAEAHAHVQTEVPIAIIDHAVATVTVLELFDHDGAQLGIDLRLEAHPAEDLKDASLL